MDLQDELKKDKKTKYKQHNHKKSPIKKVLIGFLLAGTLTLNTGFANELSEIASLQTVYHVYANGKYVGAITDEEKLEELKKEKLKETASEFNELQLTVGSDLSIVPELVFKAGGNDEKVLKKLDDMLTVEAEAVAVSINGEPALYVKDQAAYEEIIRKLKLQSITEEELEEFEARKDSNTTLPPLQENETRIVNILMSGEMSSETEITEPKNVLSVDDAIRFLQKGTLEEKVYIVQSGDVLGKIANSHGMSTADLLSINPGFTAETTLHPGDEVNVTFLEPLVKVEVHYESKSVETIQHSVVKQEDATMYKGDKRVTQAGKDGSKEVVQVIRKINGQVVGRDVVEEKVISEPVDEVTLVGTKIIPSRGTGSFIWPAQGGYVSSKMGARWGRKHEGIDIARPSGRMIKAADNGVVVKAGWHGTYGNHVVVDHKNGYTTLYAHLASISVKVGQVVPQGSKLGVMGSTGRSTGMHLHFEVEKNGVIINPLTVLNR